MYSKYQAGYLTLWVGVEEESGPRWIRAFQGCFRSLPAWTSLSALPPYIACAVVLSWYTHEAAMKGDTP